MPSKKSARKSKNEEDGEAAPGKRPSQFSGESRAKLYKQAFYAEYEQNYMDEYAFDTVYDTTNEQGSFTESFIRQAQA